MQPSLSSSSFVGYTWAFPFHFLGCTPTCSPFLWDLLMFSPFERYPHLLILFFFFFEGYTSTVPLFSRRHPRKPFSFSGVHLHSSFYPGSTHASVPPAFFFFSWDALRHLLLLFCGMHSPSPPFSRMHPYLLLLFFARYTHTAPAFVG